MFYLRPLYLSLFNVLQETSKECNYGQNKSTPSIIRPEICLTADVRDLMETGIAKAINNF